MARARLTEPLPPPAWREFWNWWSAEVRGLFRTKNADLPIREKSRRTLVVSRQGMWLETASDKIPLDDEQPLSAILTHLPRNSANAISVRLAGDLLVKRHLADQRLPLETAYKMALLDVSANTPFEPESVYAFLPAASPGASSTCYFLLRRTVVDALIGELRKAKCAAAMVSTEVDQKAYDFAPYIADFLNGKRASVSSLVRTHYFSWGIALASVATLFNVHAGISEAAKAVEQQIDTAEPSAAKARRDFKARNDHLARLSTFVEKRQRYRPLVLTLEELSRRLPDGTYLTSLAMQDNKIRLAGFSTASAALIPELDGGAFFRKPKFTAAIVKVADRNGEQFALEMEIEDAR